MVQLSGSVPGVTGLPDTEVDIRSLVDTDDLRIVNGRLLTLDQLASRVANFTFDRYDLVDDGDFVSDVILVAGFQEVSGAIFSRANEDFNITIEWLASQSTADVVYEQQPAALQQTSNALIQSVTVKGDYLRLIIQNDDDTATTNPIDGTFNIH